GRPFCTRTTDGGKTWEFVSWIGPEPSTPRGYAIMPSAVRLSPTELLVMVRRKEVTDGESKYWIDPSYSHDNGETWHLQKEPVIENGGNPPSMITLEDGRIALTYGYRRPPYGIRARLSSDKGRTWDEEIILRDDGGNWDLGYPRTVQRLDGKTVTVYYFNEAADKERYIAATIWNPGPKRTICDPVEQHIIGPWDLVPPEKPGRE
ncbi:MAG: sialidase family protein, partial [bacterium]